MALGDNHSCALLDNGEVVCWGYNILGQLGLGDAEDRGDEDGEMGDALESVDLGPGEVAVSIAAGTYHNCALLQTGKVKCWGYNGMGNLGLGDTVNRGDGGAGGEMGQLLPYTYLGEGRTIVKLSLHLG